MKEDSLYIGIIQISYPWIVYKKMSERAEHMWYSKLAILPGSYPLIWTPGLDFDNVRCDMEGRVLARKFQGQTIAIPDGAVQPYYFFCSENDVVQLTEAGSRGLPYEIRLDLAVVTTHWDHNVIRHGERMIEYREGRLKIVEGATV
jgi:hypothetical protein